MCNAVCSKEHKETYLSRNNEKLWEEKRKTKYSTEFSEASTSEEEYLSGSPEKTIKTRKQHQTNNPTNPNQPVN